MRRLWRTLVTGAVLLGGVSVLSPAVSRAAGTGSISGTVTDAGGAPIEGVLAEVAFGGSGSAMTDAAGQYTLPAVGVGSVIVQFIPPAGRPTLLPEAYNDRHRSAGGFPMFIPVTDGGAVSGIDAVLDEGGFIAGTVSDGAGTPVAGATVQATDVYFPPSTVSASDGSFTLGPLPAGSVTVSASATGYLPGQGGPFAVTGSSTLSGVSLVIETAASVAGTVRGPGGTPIAGAAVELQDFSYGGYFFAETDAGGGYLVESLPPGEYQLFVSTGDPSVADGWYPNGGPSSSAGTIVVAASAVVTGADVTLQPASTITGRVTDEHGAPLAGIDVNASGLSDTGTAVTGADGTYSVGGLASGDHIVSFAPPAGSNYLLEWYDDVTSYTAATVVSLTAGGTVSGIDAALSSGGGIVGTVHGPGGTPVAGVSVSAYSPTLDVYRFTQTSSTGGYEFLGLPTGSYVVSFSPPVSSGLLFEYYDDARLYPSRTEVAVTAGSITSGIDATLEAPLSVRGRVTDAAGNGIANVTVTASAFVCCGSFYSATTDNNGDYTLSSVAPGSYRLYFSPTSTAPYVPEYYGDTTDYSVATPVTVSTTALVGIDAQLAPAGLVTGHVSLPGGSPAAGVSVSVSGTNGSGFGSATTDATGNYSIGRLGGGDYRVTFSPTNTTGPSYLSEYYDDAATFDAAQVITVVPGSTLSGIDAQLAAGSEITGRVVNAAGAGVTGVSVAAGGDLSYVTATTDSNGDYRLRSLRSGWYVVSFSPTAASGLVTEFYDSNYRSGDADQVFAGPGQTVTGIGATLEAGGSITGTVTDAQGGPVSGAGVTASGSLVDSSATTDASGHYTVRGLPAGDYTVHAYAPYGSSLPDGDFDDPEIPGGPDQVGVVVGGAAAIADIRLVESGSISGTVTGPSGPVAGVWVSTGSKTTVTAPDGTYTITGLPTGTHYVLFTPPVALQLMAEYYDGSASGYDSTPVTVAAGVVTTGIDASLEAAAASISGTIRTPTGTPLAGATVQGYSGSSSAFALSGADGSYTLQLPAGGSYTVYATPPANTDFYNLYYPGTPDYGSIIAVTAATGASVTGIDISFVTGSIITGTVTQPSGLPIRSVYVSAGGSNDSTSADGTYRIAVPAGTYSVYFSPPSNSSWAAEYFDDAADYVSSTSVVLPPASTVTGIDAVLEPVGSITGTVLDSSGAPATGAVVWATGPGGTTTAPVGIDGSYRLDGLRPGSFIVRFQPADGSSDVGGYWDHAALEVDATGVVVNGAVVNGIDAQFVAAGPPAAPTDLVATDDESMVVLSWVDHATTETSYEIQRVRWNSVAWAEPSSTTIAADSSGWTDVVPDGQYAYLVRAVNSSGASDWAITTIIHSTATAAPAVPTGIGVVSSGADVVVSWTDNASDELGYEIQRARWVEGTWTEWATLPADRDATTATDVALPDGFYAYLVRATNPLGPSAWLVGVVQHTTAAGPPPTPGGLVLTNNGDAVDISWTDGSNAEHGFDVGRARWNPTTQTWGEWSFFLADRNRTSYSDTTATHGQYAYLVRAYNPLGGSDWQIAVIVHTDSVVVPAAPTALTATGGAGTANLAWTDNADDEVYFQVQRARWSGTAWVDWTPTALDRDSTAFTDSGLAAGQYAYLVNAANPNGSSADVIAVATVS